MIAAGGSFERKFAGHPRSGMNNERRAGMRPIDGRFGGPKNRLAIVLALAATALLLPGRAAGQLASDEVPRERTIATQAQIESELTNSRYHIGPFFVMPILDIRNLGYDSNVFGTPRIPGVSEPVSDWTADVSAGVHIVERLGPKMYLRGDALPEYTWYLKLTDRRQLGGFYRGSWVGIFNRMSFDVTGLESTSTSVLSTETLALIRTRFRSASAKLEVEIANPVSFFAKGEIQNVRYFTDSHTPADIVRASDLDRDDEAVRGGLRLRFRRNLDLTLVAEETRSRFDSEIQAAQSDNRSRAYLAGLHFDIPRLYIDLSGGIRQGRPEDGSTFPRYSTGTGSYFVSFFPVRPVELQAYGHRSTGYSLSQQNAYFFETSNGGGINLELHRRVKLRAFGEYRFNDYPTPFQLSNGTILRTDKAAVIGGGFSILFLRQAVLTSLVSNTKQTSNLPGPSRSILQFTTSISFQGDFGR
jgi:hypothetical protein